jgi:hypothetical protein
MKYQKGVEELKKLKALVLYFASGNKKRTNWLFLSQLGVECYRRILVRRKLYKSQATK